MRMLLLSFLLCNSLMADTDDIVRASIAKTTEKSDGTVETHYDYRGKLVGIRETTEPATKSKFQDKLVRTSACQCGETCTCEECQCKPGYRCNGDTCVPLLSGSVWVNGTLYTMSNSSKAQAQAFMSGKSVTFVDNQNRVVAPPSWYRPVQSYPVQSYPVQQASGG